MKRHRYTELFDLIVELEGYDPLDSHAEIHHEWIATSPTIQVWLEGQYLRVIYVCNAPAHFDEDGGLEWNNTLNSIEMEAREAAETREYVESQGYFILDGREFTLKGLLSHLYLSHTTPEQRRLTEEQKKLEAELRRLREEKEDDCYRDSSLRYCKVLGWLFPFD